MMWGPASSLRGVGAYCAVPMHVVGVLLGGVGGDEVGDQVGDELGVLPIIELVLIVADDGGGIICDLKFDL